jgi:hypothetical protein
MKEFSNTIKANTSKEKIWQIWSDVENWNKWDYDVEWSKIENSFTQGEKGFLKAVGGPKSKFVFTEVTSNKSFTTQSSLPLTKMDFVHTMEEKNGEIFLTHSIIFSGFLSSIFAKLIGEKLSKGLPNAMKNLIELAKKG